MEGLIFAVFAIAVIALFSIMMWLYRLYVKAPANRAFVRVGGPGKSLPKVVMNGGSFVVGFLHEITWVDLGTMAVEIERTEQNALLTKDPQYADIRAIFYIKVQPTTEGIMTAARTIGGKQVDAQAVKELVDAKLDGALRDVAATFTLMSLHQERENFIQEVQNRVKGDLEENGLVLESVSILTLKAARQGSFPTDDVFGAQVARANAEFIQTAASERNDIERRTELEIQKRNTSTEKEKLAMEQDLAFAAATQQREVRTRQALEKAAAEKSIYEQELATEKARLAKEREVKLTEIEIEQTILVQEERKHQELQAAEIARAQAIEVANQAKLIAVLTEEQRREAAERERLLVAAEREQAAQDVTTVEETAKAKREAQIQVIHAERDAQRAMIERKNVVEIEALKKVREAEAEAEALKARAQAEFEAAQKQAETKRTQAQAESDAEKALADAERARTSASGLAEAEVIRAKAQAMQSEAEVIRAKGLAEAEGIKAKGLAEAEAVKAKGLAEAEGEKAKAEALAAFDSVSQKLELEKIRLQAEIEVGVARARAIGDAIASMQIKMYGTPEAANSILRVLSFTEGFKDVLNAAPPEAINLGSQVVSNLLGGNGNGAHVEKSKLTVEEMTALIQESMSLVEGTLDVDELRTLSIREVLGRLEQSLTREEDRALVARVHQALAQMPFLADAAFGDMYLRYLMTQQQAGTPPGA